MDNNKQVQILQMAYAGALADAVLQLGKENVLDRVIQRKRQEQIDSGPIRAAQLGITKPEEVFLRLSQIFNCTQWDITNNPEGGFNAQANSCTLCAIARKMNAPSPCHLYCLNPMEGLIKALKKDAVYTVKETLWDGSKCVVSIK
jgi:hypothetical protein